MVGQPGDDFIDLYKEFVFVRLKLTADWPVEFNVWLWCQIFFNDVYIVYVGKSGQWLMLILFLPYQFEINDRTLQLLLVLMSRIGDFQTNACLVTNLNHSRC